MTPSTSAMPGSSSPFPGPWQNGVQSGNEFRPCSPAKMPAPGAVPPAAHDSRTSRVDFPRRQASPAAGVARVQLRASTTARFCAIALEYGKVKLGLPLSDTAARNSPCAAGAPSIAITPVAPDDWPTIITRWGSPPKFAMLRRTHRMLSIMSRNP